MTQRPSHITHVAEYNCVYVRMYVLNIYSQQNMCVAIVLLVG